MVGCLAVCLAGGAAEDGFPFPEDRGGRLLARLLPPRDAAPATIEAPAEPRRLPPPAPLAEPTLPLPPGQAPPPRLLPTPPRPSRPGPLPGEPLPSAVGQLPLPASPALAVGERVRLPAEDVTRPVPLPVLAQPVPDRAPLDDPTAEASTAAVRATPPTERAGPVPFQRLNLPDPFEHRRLLRPLPMPEEEPAPPAAAPRLPRP